MFVRFKKQQNKSGLVYKILVVESVRSAGKVRQIIWAYIGTYAEKNRDSLDHQIKFYQTIIDKFAQLNIEPHKKNELKFAIYKYFPELKITSEALRIKK